MTALYNLPYWLQNYIYGSYGSSYKCDWKKAQQNLHNTHEENINYLRAYFPRSFAEIGCIISGLKNDTQYFESLCCKKQIRILCAGCGTGGDICGLIHFIHAIAPECTFEVSLFDGNADAMNCCCTLLEGLAVNENASIVIKKRLIRVVSGISDFAFLRSCFSQQDIIITSKFLNEVLNPFCNAYYHFVKIFSELLAVEGIMIINEVICRASNGVFIPTYMNDNLNHAVREMDLSSVLPLPCRANRECTNTRCYSRFCSGNSSDFTFRVISRSSFADRIIPKVQPQNYIIDYKKEISCIVSA